MNGSLNTETSSPTNDTEPRGRNVAWIVTVVVAIPVLLFSMLGFAEKLEQLIRLTLGDYKDGSFAITPVVNYLFASAGFFFLLLWAAINGMFNDLEKPKYLMLENEERLDKAV